MLTEAEPAGPFRRRRVAAQTRDDILARARAEDARYIPHVPARMARQPEEARYDGFSFFCQYISDTSFRSLIHMTKEEALRIIADLVHVIDDATDRRAVTAEDRIFFLICMCAKDYTYRDMTEKFRISTRQMGQVLERDLPRLADWINANWIPAVDSQADVCAFDYHPWAACAVDSTPMAMPNAEKRHRYLSHALWSQKKTVVCWKIHFAVTPNCVCVAWGIGPGRRADIRLFLEDEIFLGRLEYVVQGQDGGFEKRRFATLHDAGYRSIPRELPDAIVKNVRPARGGLTLQMVDENAKLDHDRAIVEDWNGMWKRTFKIFSKEGCRWAHKFVEFLVPFTVGIMNQLRGMRGGHAHPTTARRVPVPAVPPPGAFVRDAPAPRTYRPDLVTGLTPATAEAFSTRGGPLERFWLRRRAAGPPRPHNDLSEDEDPQ
jgi:hypothetical protein